MYFNLNLDKQWNIEDFSFRSNLCVQKSNSIILSLPSFLVYQRIQYKKYFAGNVKLLTAINFSIFSKYYVNSFFPLTDVFHSQFEEKKGFIPLVSFECALYRENFYIGLNVKNLNNLIFKGESLVMNYPIPPQFFQLCVKWDFFD